MATASALSAASSSRWLSANRTSTRSTFSFSSTPPLASFLATSRSSSARRTASQGGFLQGPRAQNLVVRHRDFIGHGLVGPLALQLSNIDGETSLAIPAQPTAEVADEPLQLQVGQLVPGVDVQPNGYRSQGGKKREAGRLPHSHAEAAGVQVEAAGRIPGHGHRQERGECDVLSAPGLLDALHVDPQTRLLPESRFDGLGKRKSLSRFNARAASLSRNEHYGTLGVNVIRRSGLSKLCLDYAG